MRTETILSKLKAIRAEQPEIAECLEELVKLRGMLDVPMAEKLEALRSAVTSYRAKLASVPAAIEAAYREAMGHAPSRLSADAYWNTSAAKKAAEEIARG